MRGLLHSKDWAATPLGPRDAWPQSLATVVELILDLPMAMIVLWGPDLVQIYNEGYAEIAANRHPAALGQPTRECWPEVWDFNAPVYAAVLRGEARSFVAQKLVIRRRGTLEDAWFDLTYSALRDDAGATIGVLVTVVDVTAKVLAVARQDFRLGLDLRLRPLREPVEVLTVASQVLGQYLGAGQVAYADIDGSGDFAMVESEWNDGSLPSLAGRHRLADFGAEISAGLKRGETIMASDVRIDPRTASPQALKAFRRTAVVAFLAVPLLKSGRLAALLVLHRATPQAWLPADMVLAEEVAQRTWDAVERARAEATLRLSEERWRTIFENMHEGFALCEMVYGADGQAIDFRYLELNAAWERLTPLTVAETLGRTARQCFDNYEEFWIRIYAEVVETGVPAHFEYQISSIGRWYEVIAYRTEPGRFAAMFLNITARKAAEDRQELMAREVDHRAKNALSVVQAVLRLTEKTSIADYALAVEGRVTALARAQTLLAEEHWYGAPLLALLQGELALFLGGQRVELEGLPVILPPGTAQPFAMAVHELATNALKYGALSTAEGRVVISWRIAGAPPGLLHLCWVETGGPPIKGPPSRRGFGTRVMEGTVRGQLGGEVSKAWNPAGLRCDLSVPLAQSAPLPETTGIDEVRTYAD